MAHRQVWVSDCGWRGGGHEDEAELEKEAHASKPRLRVQNLWLESEARPVIKQTKYTET